MKSKFLVLFFILGLVLSLVCGFIVGNKILHILTVALISAMCLGLVGLGSYVILEQKVPEFINFLQELSFSSSYDYSEDYEEESESSSEEYVSSSVSESSSDETFASTSPEKKESGKFGDHILVDNIPIKNEPKLMAEAIRTMMALDDTPASSQQTQQHHGKHHSKHHK